MTENMRRVRHAARTILTYATMTLLMAATAFAATTPPIRSGEYKVPTREYYEFQGWYANPEGTGDMVIDAEGNWLVDLDEDATVYAKWKGLPAVLMYGNGFSGKIKQLSGSANANGNTINNIITGFQQAASIPVGMTMTEANIISDPASAYPVYAWFDDSTKIIYWYSDADIVEMNVNSQNMFNNCRKITTLDLSMFDTSNVTNMTQMFENDIALTSLNIDGWDTKNVTVMNNMFSGCSGLTSLDVSGFDTSNVTNMSNMFSNCSKLTSLDVNVIKLRVPDPEPCIELC